MAGPPASGSALPKAGIHRLLVDNRGLSAREAGGAEDAGEFLAHGSDAIACRGCEVSEDVVDVDGLDQVAGCVTGSRVSMMPTGSILMNSPSSASLRRTAPITCEGEHMESIEWLPATLRDCATERKLAARQFLFRQGDASVGVYKVVSGKVKLEQTDLTGRPIVLGFVSTGDTIAEASLFASAYRSDATAMTESVVQVYAKTALIAELERNPRAALAFMVVLARRVVDVRNRLECRSLYSARDRVRHYLEHNAQPRDRTVVMPSTLKDLASELGLTHEALYRTLSEMEAEGEIVRSRGKIMIVSYSYDWDHMNLVQTRL